MNFFFFFFGGGTGVQTQGLYHLNHTSSPEVLLLKNAKLA
jgi:hypothetical protein